MNELIFFLSYVAGIAGTAGGLVAHEYYRHEVTAPTEYDLRAGPHWGDGDIVRVIFSSLLWPVGLPVNLAIELALRVGTSLGAKARTRRLQAELEHKRIEAELREVDRLLESGGARR